MNDAVRIGMYTAITVLGLYVTTSVNVILIMPIVIAALLTFIAGYDTAQRGAACPYARVRTHAKD